MNVALLGEQHYTQMFSQAHCKHIFKQKLMHESLEGYYHDIQKWKLAKCPSIDKHTKKKCVFT